jgi:transcriptional regulator with XRE-family HTH domain
MDIHSTPGQLIRDLRRKRNISGEVLARKTGLSQTKISKIETGAIPQAKEADLETILNILEAPQTIRQQILVRGNFTSGPTYDFWQKRTFDETSRLVLSTAFIRTFMINLLPALLQTVEYRESYLKRMGFEAQTLTKAMSSALRQQDMLWDKRKRFHFIIYEGAFYTAPGTSIVQRAQLDRIERFIGSVANIKVGVIPLETGLAPAENGTFAIYDDRVVINVLAGGHVALTDSLEVASYHKLFAELDHRADYGDIARTTVQKAISFFST